MGRSSQGILAYGYDLGGGGGTWKVREAADNDFGILCTPWYDGNAALDDEDEQGEEAPEPDTEVSGPFDAMISFLYAQIGGASADAGTPIDDREKAVEEHFAVTFVDHGDDYNWPQAKILAAYHTTNLYGQTEPLDLAALQARAVAEDWDGKLSRLLALLGLTPLAHRPTWQLGCVDRA